MPGQPAATAATPPQMPAAGRLGGGRQRPPAPAWRRTFVALCASQTIAMLAFSMALPFLPLYVQRLGVEDPRAAARWAGAMAAGGAVIMAVMAPVWGAIADRYGRKPMVARALIGGGAVVAL